MKQLSFYLLLLICLVTKGLAQDVGLETLYHTDCNNHLIASKINSVEENFVAAGPIALKKVIYEGVPGKNLISGNGILIPQDEYDKYFQKGLPTRVYQSFLANFQTDFNNYENTLFVVTDEPNGVVTFFYISNGAIRGYPHKSTVEGCITINKLFSSEFKRAKQRNATIYWYGKEINGINLDQPAVEAGVTIYRRAPGVSKAFPINLDQFLPTIDPQQTALLNGIPANDKALYSAGIDPSLYSAYKDLHSDVAAATDQFNEHISSVQDFKRALLEGDQDVLYIFAHLENSDLYIGGEKVKLSDIEQWGARSSVRSGRKAILFVCNAGNQNYKAGLFWKTKIEPLANILIKNKYFDIVLAPDHTIGSSEVNQQLTKLIKPTDAVPQHTGLLNGWWWFVQNKLPKTIAPRS